MTDKKTNSSYRCHALYGRALSAVLVLALNACGGDNAGPAVGAVAAPATDMAAASLPFAKDQPYIDPISYSGAPDAALDSAMEGAAIVHRDAQVKGQSIRYTATTGHLLTRDKNTLQENAAIFYVAYTADNVEARERPITFVYNGGPGSSSIWLLMGSFAPKFTPTEMPDFTSPAPYRLEDNPDTLLDKTDLVFIHPVGTGYSTAIKPFKNRQFWGADQDAESIKQFIKRYLVVNGSRMNSPKFLLGESYGGHRSSILSLMLQREGIDLNGIALIGPSTDNGLNEASAGKLPTFTANAWYHKRLLPEHNAKPLDKLIAEVVHFTDTQYAPALKDPALMTPELKAKVAAYSGLPETMLAANGDLPMSGVFRTQLMRDQSLAIGRYDGRATRIYTGVATAVSDDPSSLNIQSAFYATFNTLLQRELKFIPTTILTADPQSTVINNWDWTHKQPGRAPGGDEYEELASAEDLALTMSLNPELKVFVATGYYDSAINFHQTTLNFLGTSLNPKLKAANLELKSYPSGHMLYLDQKVKATLRADVGAFYDRATQPEAMSRINQRRQQIALNP